MVRDKVCDVGSAKIIPATVIGCCVSYLIPIFIVLYFAMDSIHILTKMKKNFTKMNSNITMTSTTIGEIASTAIAAIPVTVRNDLSNSIPENNNCTHKGTIKMKTHQRTSKANAYRGTIKAASQRLQSFSTTLDDYHWVATFNVLLGISFIVNILPFGVLSVARSVCLHLNGSSCVSTEWWYFGYIMCYFNSMLNPVCYAFGNKNFKRAFKLILCRKEAYKSTMPTLTITEDLANH